MATFANTTHFFHDAAPQYQQPAEVTDPLERAILNTQRKDSAIVHRAIQWLADLLTKSEDRTDDRLEQAILACQRRDTAIIRHVLGG